MVSRALDEVGLASLGPEPTSLIGWPMAQQRRVEVKTVMTARPNASGRVPLRVEHVLLKAPTAEQVAELHKEKEGKVFITASFDGPVSPEQRKELFAAGVGEINFVSS